MATVQNYGDTAAAGVGNSLWVFQQLGGPKRRLELADHAAPHGRPRKGPIASDGIQIIHQETRYPGNDVPDRHLYGPEREPLELEGRFQDHFGGRGFAKAKTEEVKRFVADQQEVLVTWADVISVTGLIDYFRPAREARGDVFWEMSILVDVDNLLGQVSDIPEQRTPTDFTDEIVRALVDVDEIPRTPETMKGSVFDALSAFVAGVSSATSNCVEVADQIDSFLDAPVALLAQFRAALNQLRTAIIRLRTSFDDLRVDLVLEAQRANEQQRWFVSQAGFGAAAGTVLGIIAEADRAAVMAERGDFKAMHVARENETWEEISQQHYGGPERAADIREANGVEPGQPPVAGTFYRIPV